MAFIDEKGRVFGKINLIDFTLLIGVIIVAAIVLVFATKEGKVVTVPENKTIEYTMIVKGIRSDVASYIKTGDLVKKQVTQGPIGTVKAVKVVPAHEIVITDEGRKVDSISPTEKDAYITIVTKGRAGNDIIATGNEVLRVGDRFNILTKWFLGDAVIIKMSVIGDNS